MERIKITDYVSEYEFRRATALKYQTSSLRPVIQERKKKPDNDDRVLMKRPTVVVESRTHRGGEDLQQGGGYDRNRIGDGHPNSNVKKKGKSDQESEVPIAEGDRRKRRKRKEKSGRKGSQKADKKSTPKVAKKVSGSLKSAIDDMQKSANVSWDTDQRWDEDSAWDFAGEGASSTKGFKKGIEEMVQVIVKVIKAVASTTLLLVILIMTCSLFIVITVLWASSDAGGSGRGERIANPTSNKQVIYNGLLETFEGNETAVYGVMCALMAESGCDPTATEATGKWGISAADYTAKVNAGTVTKEEFINSTYNGVQGSRGYGIAQWSTTGRKKALYEFAENWAMEKGEDFNIGGIEMQVAHLQETINTSYASMKEALIKGKDMVKACYLWIATYEKPSEKYSAWQEKAERDVRDFAEDLKTECSVSTGQGMFLWPCPFSKSITSYFGNRVAPKAGASTDHKGIDIGCIPGRVGHFSCSREGNYCRI